MATAQATVLSSISGNLAGMREEYLSAISNTLPQVSRFIITSRGEWCCLPSDGGPCVWPERGKTCVAQVATIGGQAVCAAACGKNHWSRCKWCACMHACLCQSPQQPLCCLTRTLSGVQLLPGSSHPWSLTQVMAVAWRMALMSLFGGHVPRAGCNMNLDQCDNRSLLCDQLWHDMATLHVPNPPTNPTFLAVQGGFSAVPPPPLLAAAPPFSHSAMSRQVLLVAVLIPSCLLSLAAAVGVVVMWYLRHGSATRKQPDAAKPQRKSMVQWARAFMRRIPTARNSAPGMSSETTLLLTDIQVGCANGLCRGGWCVCCIYAGRYSRVLRLLWVSNAKGSACVVCLHSRQDQHCDVCSLLA